jgi:hypothetical protein
MDGKMLILPQDYHDILNILSFIFIWKYFKEYIYSHLKKTFWNYANQKQQHQLLIQRNGRISECFNREAQELWLENESCS